MRLKRQLDAPVVCAVPPRSCAITVSIACNRLLHPTPPTASTYAPSLHVLVGLCTCIRRSPYTLVAPDAAHCQQLRTVIYFFSNRIFFLSPAAPCLPRRPHSKHLRWAIFFLLNAGATVSRICMVSRVMKDCARLSEFRVQGLGFRV